MVHSQAVNIYRFVHSLVFTQILQKATGTVKEAIIDDLFKTGREAENELSDEEKRILNGEY